LAETKAIKPKSDFNHRRELHLEDSEDSNHSGKDNSEKDVLLSSLRQSKRFDGQIFLGYAFDDNLGRVSQADSRTKGLDHGKIKWRSINHVSPLLNCG
jgi:hypothetical protein